MTDLNHAGTLSDEEIVGLTLKNQDYFLLVVERYKSKLFNFIRRLTNIRPQDAEDLLQDLFLKVYLNLNDFDRDLRFSSWIYAIARNEVISHHRRLQARAEGHQIDWEDESINKLAANIDLQKSVDRNLLKENVAKIMNKMDERHREVLVLKFLEDKDYKEISDIIRRPVGTVGSLINRAKQEFKKEMEKQIIKI